MMALSHLWLCDKSTFHLLWRWFSFERCAIRGLCVSVCLHVFWCLCVSECAHTPTPTLTLRLWWVRASATSVHHHRYGLWLDSRSGGAQDILSTLSCLLIMISCDGYPTSYRRHGAHTPANWHMRALGLCYMSNSTVVLSKAVLWGLNLAALCFSNSLWIANESGV